MKMKNKRVCEFFSRPYIDMVPNDADAYYGRGNAKNKINDYGKAIMINPNCAEAYYNRGLAKIKEKYKDNGCVDLNKAKELGLEQATKELRKHCK